MNHTDPTQQNNSQENQTIEEFPSESETHVGMRQHDPSEEDVVHATDEQVSEHRLKTKDHFFTICTECKGRGSLRVKLSKRLRRRYHNAMRSFEQGIGDSQAPERPKGSLHTCPYCKGSGLTSAMSTRKADEIRFPKVAIIGAGIGGVALAVACLHRGIPFTLYERDSGFNVRSQGYGLTLQQASNAIKGLGLFSLDEGITSTRHVVQNTDGELIVEWGRRVSVPNDEQKLAKRFNIHIPRQTLRHELLKQLPDQEVVQWGHQLVDVQTTTDGDAALRFEVNGVLKTERADLVVGADGIRSVVRKLLIGDEVCALRYVGCIVILGICPLDQLHGFEHQLLDSKTVFQTVNGFDRMYMMPYTADSVMWQFSVPMSEAEAQRLSAEGPQALKEETLRRTLWSAPVPQVIEATDISLITGYPVYDRPVLAAEALQGMGSVTLIGDAAHPMSPFKGQGANQALLDALALSRRMYSVYSEHKQKGEVDIRTTVLSEFENEMLRRTAPKVHDSAEAALLLHSASVLREGDSQKRRGLQRVAG